MAALENPIEMLDHVHFESNRGGRSRDGSQNRKELTIHATFETPQSHTTAPTIAISTLS